MTLLDVEVIKKLAEEGKSKEEIISILKVPSSSFYRFLKKNNISIKPSSKFISPEEKEKINDLIKQGMTPKEVSIILQRSLDSVLSYSKVTRKANKCKVSIDKLLELHGLGMHPKEIAALFNVNVSSIRHSLARRGLTPAKQKYACEQHRDAIIEMINQGKTQVEICKELDIYSNTLNHFIKRNDLDVVKNLRYSSSQGERDVFEFLSRFNPVQKYRYLGSSLKEIDIYIPEKQIGIEYCGIHWHTEQKRGKTLHIDKLKDCQKAGIDLFTIFDYEWTNKRSIVESVLMSKLGVFSETIGARKCIVREIPSSQSFPFFKENHLQASPPNQTLAVGLFYDERLVGCMSFGRHHRDPRITILNRLAFSMGTQILGGASKMFKFARSKLSSPIYTYSDNRWSNGGIYKTLGFEKVADLPLDYFYVKNGKVYSKQSKKKKPHERGGETEYELRLKEGYDRVWDCGKVKWRHNGR